LDDELVHSDKCHCVCPLYEEDELCCIPVGNWMRNPSSENAQAVINRINAIDVDAWIKHMIEIGAVEPE
jgi:hypothetical protein